MIGVATPSAPTPAWHAGFLPLLPTIVRQASVRYPSGLIVAWVRLAGS
jgi:hypothetical protein